MSEFWKQARPAFWLLLLVMTGFGPLARVVLGADRPNFVFVITDDQRWDALGVVQREQGDKARFPWFRTPNLDRLASEGIRFRNAFVVNSLCSPSRACFLTGRYSHYNGIVNNHTAFDAKTATYASLLRSAGYRTGYVGKWHMGPQKGQRPGFDESASFVGQGKYFDCPVEVNGVVQETKGWVDDVSTDFAINFLKKQKPDQPFMLFVGFKSSHGPWEPPARLHDKYTKDVSKPPANANHRPPYLGQPPAERKNINQFDTKAAQDRSAMQRNYFRTLTGVDENVGRLLETLDNLKQSENTVVIFTSDNGFYLGEHGLGDKRSAYDESLRIPLLLRYPKQVTKGQVLDQMVLNLDLAPTLLDLAGVAIPKEMQGRSWKPLWDRSVPTPPWRQSFFYEYFLEASMGPPTILAVRTESAKIIKYPGHEEWTEVFDLKADPHEIQNLTKSTQDEHRQLVDRMQTEFVKQSQSVGFFIPPFADKPGEPPAARTQRASGARSNKFVLNYDFTKSFKTTIANQSVGVDAATSGSITKVIWDQQEQAARFEGDGRIQVANNPLLDCSGGPWGFAAKVRSEVSNGVILARGGETQGYALHLENGKPVATVRAGGKVFQVKGKDDLVGRWVQLFGVITKDRKLRLYVDGQMVGETTLDGFIAKNPTDTMQIGIDQGSQVTRYSGSPAFKGWIASVRLFSGEPSTEIIRGAKS